MVISWWWLWGVFLLVFLLPPVGYGWGYRGWGPPYPRYIQRRRAAGTIADRATTVDHEAWGWGGDFVWMMMMLAIVCLGALLMR